MARAQKKVALSCVNIIHPIGLRSWVAPYVDFGMLRVKKSDMGQYLQTVRDFFLMD